MHHFENELDLRLNDMIAQRTRKPLEWEPPQMFDLSDESDRQELEHKFDVGEVHGVHDEIGAIANELYEWENPDKKADQQERAAFVHDITSQGARYGRWVLFPWSSELVRYPEKDQHRALRTSRNRSLITGEEQQRLYESTAAVFGLSVGSNVVEKLVASGIGGKIIIGDPDRLEPSNLNRIAGGFSDVGSKKVDLMARKISEIDPYIEQVHFLEGVTRESLSDLAAHRPNVIFDEVDDLDAKAAMRKFASAEGIPLVMATDLGDRSIIDVERYDLGDTQPFNGRLKAHEVDKLYDGSYTAEERGKFMLKIVGVRHVTTRMLDSVMHVDKTLAGLPQLGTTASIGGALAAIAAREIILGRKLPSGRYVCSPKKIMGLPAQASLSESLTTIRQFVKAK
ncbi:MAG: UBA/THIF-type binding protein [Candidatus Saccharibacteria bacterium]|nr:UBA/THIF-type binding protein [Candidatus Saccharibacteria bacterium]